ncbi:MAG: hypothetical protein IRZ21_07280 [Thermoleophilaceae bacterium]|nr:hypothetical protein [Thermoleophilaceae bacterium]
MKEPRGTFARVAGLVGGAAAALRGRGTQRAPRAVAYDAAGHPRVLPTSAGAGAELVQIAERMIALAPRRRRERP